LIRKKIRKKKAGRAQKLLLDLKFGAWLTLRSHILWLVGYGRGGGFKAIQPTTSQEEVRDLRHGLEIAANRPVWASQPMVRCFS
jgi:hypothetical protein